MDAIIIAIVGLIQAVSVAVIGGILKRDEKKRTAHNEKMERHAADRANESALSMQITSASMRLGIATAYAVKEGRSNGKMDAALENAEKIQEGYFGFINKMASERLTES